MRRPEFFLQQFSVCCKVQLLSDRPQAVAFMRPRLSWSAAALRGRIVARSAGRPLTVVQGYPRAREVPLRRFPVARASLPCERTEGARSSPERAAKRRSDLHEPRSGGVAKASRAAAEHALQRAQRAFPGAECSEHRSGVQRAPERSEGQAQRSIGASAAQRFAADKGRGQQRDRGTRTSDASAAQRATERPTAPPQEGMAPNRRGGRGPRAEGEVGRGRPPGGEGRGGAPPARKQRALCEAAKRQRARI